MSAMQAKHMLEVDEDADNRIKDVQDLQHEIHDLLKEVHLLTKKKK
jgi:hypothetical protein